MVRETVAPVVDATETKADTFKRLCGKRVANALEKIDLIGNCANRNQYEYTPEQVEKIRQALITKIEFTMNKFADKAKAVSATFEL